MKISNRDWVQLSAYLDGEMSPREIKKIEERLTKEPVLQLALEELHQTKLTLQQTPKLKVPRNFFLTPAMVGLKTRPRPVRRYRLASALMTFMLIGVLVLDYGRAFVSGSMAPAAPKEVMLEAISDSAADALEEPVLMDAEGVIESDRAVAETEAGAPLEEESPPPQAVAEAVEEGEALGAAQETESKSTEEEATDPEVTTNQAEDGQKDEVAEELAVPSQTFAPEIPGTPVPQPSPSVYFPDDEIHRIEKIPSIDPLRILEVIFGLGALSFGIAAWVIRRRKS
jgi:hypothetical protein